MNAFRKTSILSLIMGVKYISPTIHYKIVEGPEELPLKGLKHSEPYNLCLNVSQEGDETLNSRDHP